MEPKYSIDIPISASDVERWSMSMKDSLRCSPGGTSFGHPEGNLDDLYAPDSSSASSSSWLCSSYPCSSLPFYLPGEVLAMGSPEQQRAAVHSLAPLPSFNPNAKQGSGKTVSQVLQHRREWLPHRQQFAVAHQQIDLLDALSEHLVVALVGVSKSGKTLQLPQLLSESGAFKRSRILLVVPSETAAQLVAWRLREEVGDAIDCASTIGYVSSLSVSCHSHTRIVTMTSDVLLRQLICDPTLVGVRAIIIDDVHLRSERTELCLGLLRELLVEISAHRLAVGLPAASSLISSIRLIINCVDNDTAKQMTEYFSGVPSKIFPLHSLSPSSPSFSLFSGMHRSANSVETPKPVIFYLDDTVQWLNKCVSEQRSSFCQFPEEDLASYMGKVEVVTQIMAASEADFQEESKCRQYWCELMKNAVLHFDQADREWVQEQEEKDKTVFFPSLSVVVVSIPESEYAMRVVKDELQKFISSCAQMQNEIPGERRSSPFELHCVFSSDDMASTLYNKILPSLSCSFSPKDTVKGKEIFHTVRSRHILLGSSELLECLLPPNVNVGLIVDFARQHTCWFNIETAADQWSTEYAHTSVLQRCRRVVGSNSYYSTHQNRNLLASEEEEEALNASTPPALPPPPPPLVIHLIPKSLLHSAQRRRQHHDKGHHTIFRLSSSQYLGLYQVLQLREDVRLAASLRRGTAASFRLENDAGASALTTNSSTTITERIGSVFAQYFIGVPAPTSSKYEQSKRVFQQLEIFLRAAGHLLVSAKDGSSTAVLPHEAPSEAFLQPLGILTVCWLFPISITRLLTFGAILDRSLETTAVAAIWLGGDAFEPYLKKLREKGDPLTISTSEAIALEARNFFTKDYSDISALFFLYKMWLDQKDGGEEQEEAFLSECQADRETLLRVHRYHGELLEFLLRNGMMKSTSVGISEAQWSRACRMDQKEFLHHVAKRIIELPDSAFMEDAVQMAISASVYPHYGVTSPSGAIKLYEGVNASGTRTQRAAVFSKSCVMHQKQILQKLQEIPVTFLSKVMITGLRDQRRLSSSVSSTSVSVLQQGIILHQPASLLVCGEAKEKPLDTPSRCRGWCSVLTSSWRKTRRARILPPVAELPPVSIPLQAFDMTGSHQVLVSVDGQLQFVMRSTVAKWLRQLRWYIQRMIYGMVSHSRSNTSAEQLCDVFHHQKEEVIEAWNWLCRRRASAAEWRREERQKYAIIRKKTEAADVHDDSDGGGGTGGVLRLYPFYGFQTVPGTPTAVVVPQQKKQSLGMAEENEEDGAVRDENHQEQAEQYKGKLPSVDVDSVIRYCVTAIAESGSRKAENKLLKDNPETFSFLEPSDELHEYYLYLLKKAAPNIEILGDDVDGLLVFLKELEAELREEHGLPPLEEAGVEGPNSNALEEGETGADGLLRVEDAENDEEDEGFKGMQEEEAFSLRKNIVARAIHHPPTASMSDAQAAPLSTDFSSTLKEQPSALSSTPGAPFDPTEAPGSELSGHDRPPLSGASFHSSPSNPLTASPSQADASADSSRAKELLSLIDGQMGASTFYSNSSTDSSAALLKPTVSELTALLGKSEHNPGRQSEEPSTAELPLHRPPPPLPAAMVENNVPSVLVYPVPYSPSCPRTGIPRELCKALGEQLGLRVGPAVTVGKITRITVPNKKVERRCLTMGCFQCLGQMVYLFRNDRIIENPQKEIVNPQVPPFPQAMNVPGMMLPTQHGGLPLYMQPPPSSGEMMLHPTPPFPHSAYPSRPGMGFNYSSSPSQPSSAPPYMFSPPSMMQPGYDYFPQNTNPLPHLPLPGNNQPMQSQPSFPLSASQNSFLNSGSIPGSVQETMESGLSGEVSGSLPFSPTEEQKNQMVSQSFQTLDSSVTSPHYTVSQQGESGMAVKNDI